jgi:hypothetical protein
MATRQDPQPRGTLLERVLVTQVVLAGAVSLLTAGRMSLRLMLGTMLAWLMVPVIQLAVIMLTHWVSGTRRSRIETASLYMAGNAPPLLLLLFVSGVCIFTPNVAAAFSLLMRSFVLPVAVVVTRVFGWVLSYACYRSALELSRGRAAVCLVVDMLFASLLVIGWYVSIDNIIPQLTGAP